jgi:hypothetical protein
VELLLLLKRAGDAVGRHLRSIQRARQQGALLLLGLLCAWRVRTVQQRLLLLLPPRADEHLWRCWGKAAQAHQQQPRRPPPTPAWLCVDVASTAALARRPHRRRDSREGSSMQAMKSADHR